MIKLVLRRASIVAAAGVLGGAVAFGATLAAGPAGAATGVDTSSQSAFIRSVAPLAQAGYEQYKVPASVAIAQSILESGWGKSDLTKKGNAYFGIKCSSKMGPYATGCLYFKTYEYDGGKHLITDGFRSYANAGDSFKDHGWFLKNNSRYRKAFDYSQNPNQFIAEVHKAGYATDPTYTQMIVGLMKSYDLYRYDKAPAKTTDPVKPAPAPVKSSSAPAQPSKAPSVTPTASPSATASASKSATVTPAPSKSATASPSPSSGVTVTPAPSKSATASPSPSSGATTTPAPSKSATASPSAPSVDKSTASPAPSASSGASQASPGAGKGIPSVGGGSGSKGTTGTASSTPSAGHSPSQPAQDPGSVQAEREQDPNTAGAQQVSRLKADGPPVPRNKVQGQQQRRTTGSGRATGSDGSVKDTQGGLASTGN